MNVIETEDCIRDVEVQELVGEVPHSPDKRKLWIDKE